MSEEMGVQLFQLAGGLDLATAPTHAHPGTLQECLNFEVGLTDGYRRIDGLERFDGRLVASHRWALFSLRAQYDSAETFGKLVNVDAIETGQKLFWQRVVKVGPDGQIYGEPEEFFCVEPPVFETNLSSVDFSVRTGLFFCPRPENVLPGINKVDGDFYFQNNPDVIGDVALSTEQAYGSGIGVSVAGSIAIGASFPEPSPSPIPAEAHRQSIGQHPGGSSLGGHWFQGRLHTVAESMVFEIGVAGDPEESTLDDDVFDLIEEGQWLYYATDYYLVTEGVMGVRSPRSLIDAPVANESYVTGRIISAGGDLELLLPEPDPGRIGQTMDPKGRQAFLLTEIKIVNIDQIVEPGDTVTTSGGYQATVRFAAIQDQDEGTLLVETVSGTLSAGDELIFDTNPLGIVASTFGGSSAGNALCTLGGHDPSMNRGVLVRSTPTTGFEPMPMGYEIEFEDGENEPLSLYDRGDSEAGTPRDTGLVTGGAATNRALGAGGYNWFIPGDGSLASSFGSLNNDQKILAGEKVESNDSDFVAYRLGPVRTHYLVIQDLGIDINQFDRITGITIEAVVGKGINNHPLWLASAGFYDPDQDRAWVKEINQSITVDVDAKTSISVGGGSETFSSGESGQPDLTPEMVNKRRFGAVLQFRSNQTRAASAAMDVRVYQVQVKVHYEDGSTEVWLREGSDDLASVRVAHKYLRGGSWSGNDAHGVLSVFGSITTNVPAGAQIRNGPDGTGALIGLAKSPPQRARLPNRQALDRERSQYQFMTSNFFGSDDLEAVYGVSGAGMPFTFADGYFFFFRTGLDEDLLKPRHISRVRDRLVLAYKNGNADLSTPGEPLDFDAATGGAATLGVGEKITGLLPLQGEVLAVFTESRIIGWHGADNEAFTSNIISPSSGAIEYTVVDMGIPIFCDFRGIGTIATSEKYGDFQTGRMSEMVHRWLSPRLQGTRRDDGVDRSVAGVLLVRNKSQYRVIFRDGWVLTMTLRSEFPQFTTQRYMAKRDDDYRASDGTEFDTPIEWQSELEPIRFRAACWGVMQSGQDRIFLSADNYPHVLEVDRGNSFDGQEIESFITTNPMSAGAPESHHRFNVLHVHGRVNGFATLDHQVGVNYALPGGKPTPFRLGSPNDPYEPGERPAFTKSRTSAVGRDISLKINHKSATEQPFVLQSYNWIDASPRRTER